MTQLQNNNYIQYSQSHYSFIERYPEDVKVRFALITKKPKFGDGYICNNANKVILQWDQSQYMIDTYELTDIGILIVKLITRH